VINYRDFRMTKFTLIHLINRHFLC